MILKGLRWLAKKVLLPFIRKPIRQHVIDATEKGLEKFVQEPSPPQDVVDTLNEPPPPVHVDQLRLPCHDKEESPPEVESSIEIDSDLEDLEEDAETKEEDWSALATENVQQDDYEDNFLALVDEANQRQAVETYDIPSEDLDAASRRVQVIGNYIRTNSERASQTDFLDPWEIYQIEKEHGLYLGGTVTIDDREC
jgi:hypothetical protein